jgi:hypothetical protein
MPLEWRVHNSKPRPLQNGTRGSANAECSRHAFVRDASLRSRWCGERPVQRQWQRSAQVNVQSTNMVRLHKSPAHDASAIGKQTQFGRDVTAIVMPNKGELWL